MPTHQNPNPYPEMAISRSSSISSVRSARGSKQGTYICRHAVSGSSRFNDVLGALPIQVKTRKCFDCQTATAEGTLTLLEAVRDHSPGLTGAEGPALRRLAEVLFERLAGARRAALRDDWDEVLARYAGACYAHVPAPELRAACETARARWGSGVDGQLLRALARAACVAEGVWEFRAPRDAPAHAAVNAAVQALRARVGVVDRFARVEDVFRAARELGRAGHDAAVAFERAAERFDRWDRASR